MGFDNECIPNIQSLAGEYFCPVCRLLVYPNEALQSQCSHLYCKPCLTYIVSTSRACPYDGYLVTEADSKPLTESNKALAETIGKIVVHCLYHRSGCTWQGALSDSTSHCTGCAFGNSPVVCNRCGIQIVHRQVQEHAQNCPGVQVQSQAQQVGGSQDAAVSGTAAAVSGTTAAGNQTQTSKVGATTIESQTSQTTPAPGNGSIQQASSNSQVQVVSAAGLTPEAWYQQQYQQYYQQYPGYDPYQQHYQQYYPYQQQAVMQYQQPQAHTPQMGGQHQAQLYAQPQPQPQPLVPPQSQGQGQMQPQNQTQSQPPPQMPAQSQPQPQMPAQSQPQPQMPAQSQPQPQMQAQSHPQLQSMGQPQSHPLVQAPVCSQPQSQAQVNPQPQAHPVSLQQSQASSQTHPPSLGHQQLQAQPSPQAHPSQQHLQHVQMPQYQQASVQGQQLQPQFQPQAHSLVHAQHHPVPQSQAQAQQHIHHHSQPHLQTNLSQPNQSFNPNTQSQMLQPSALSVTGHQSYPQTQPHLQIQSGAPQHTIHVQPQGGSHTLSQPPVQIQNQYPQQSPNLRPPQSHATMLNQQQPALLPSPGQVPSIPLTQQHQPLNSHAHQPALLSRPIMQPVQQSMPQQYAQQQPFAGQLPGPFHNQIHQQVPFPQQQLPVQSHLRPQGQVQSLQQFPQPQQTVTLSQSMQPHQSQTVAERPMMRNHGLQPQQYQQSVIGVQGRLMQPGSRLPGVQTDVLGTNNQVQLSSEQQSGASFKPTVPEKHGDHMIERSTDEKEDASSSGKDAKKGTNELNGTSSSGNDAVSSKSLKPDTVLKNSGDDMKPKDEVENKRSTSAVIESHAPENGEALTKQIVKEEVPVTTDKLARHSIVDEKEIWDSSLMKAPPLQGAEKLEEQNGKVTKDKTHAQMMGSTQRPGVHPPGKMQAGGVLPDEGRHQPSVNYGLQALPGPPPRMPAPAHPPVQFGLQGPGLLGPPLIPHGSDILPGGVPGPTSGASFGRGPSQYGLPQHGTEPPLVSSQGLYGHPPPPHAPRVSPNALDSHAGMIARAPPHGPEVLFGQQQPINLVETEMLLNQKPGLMERGPHGRPYASAFGLRDERSKPLQDEHLDPFSMDPSRRGDLEYPKQFPWSSHFDAESGPKFGNYFSSSRPLDRGSHGFSMDVPLRAHEKGLHGLNFDPGLKLDQMAGSVTSRFFPTYNDAGERPLSLHEDSKGRLENARIHPDFLGPVPGSGRRHMDGLNPRSPMREYPGISPRGFGALHGGLGSSHLGLDDMDHREPRPFGLPSHLHRAEFGGLGNFRMGEHMRSGDMIGPDLAGNIRRGEHLGSRSMTGNLRLEESMGFSAFHSHSRMGEIGGSGNFSHNRIGEPGFRSSFTLQGFPDGGVYTGDMESGENFRKRKSISMGWCRICKVDCETVEGLEFHSQTREHQKMAMDMVITIKENAKKHKLSTSDHPSVDDVNKPRNSNFDGRGNRN